MRKRSARMAARKKREVTMTRLPLVLIALCVLVPVAAAQPPERRGSATRPRSTAPSAADRRPSPTSTATAIPTSSATARSTRTTRGKRFLDVTKESGVAGSGTACVADIDNDGLPDIYFCGGKGSLYRNLGKMRFEDWTKKVPAEQAPALRRPPRSATWTATATSICTSPTTRTGRTTPTRIPTCCSATRAATRASSRGGRPRATR